MEIISTKNIEEKDYLAFFNEEKQVFNHEEMKQYGYFLYLKEEAIAFFSLLPAGEKAYWLSKLVMKSNTPILLPVTIIEAAERLTKSYGAEALFIHSHTAMLDDLLTQLGYRHSNHVIDETINAKWWKTNIKNVNKHLTYTQE